MDESYKSLFIELARSAQILAERVMNYDKKNNDKEGYKTAEMMRNDYIRMEDLIKENKVLEYNDYMKLLAATYMVVNNLQDQINSYQKAINGYKTTVIPKLSRIMEEAKDNPEKLNELVENLFKISKV